MGFVVKFFMYIFSYKLQSLTAHTKDGKQDGYAQLSDNKPQTPGTLDPLNPQKNPTTLTYSVIG